MLDLSFYKGKKVLITGHSGFKGSWMCQLLTMAGAELTGYSLEPPTQPNLFEICRIAENMNSITGDIRDLQHLEQIFRDICPDIVIHMAAQPLVRESYKEPVYTYDVNVMGTVHVLECIRKTPSVKSFVNVTTDKVYRNREWEWGYRENEELNGFDPYSNSKSCSELVTSSYKNSFFNGRDIGISTMRGGNVIGGGDFANDRIIPDCIRAAVKQDSIVVRNPFSIRPYEHVLELVTAYLMVAQAQYLNHEVAGSYNVGPNDSDCLTTGNLVTLFCNKWNDAMGSSVGWVNQYDGGPHEANFLKLDCSKLKMAFGWKPRWGIETAIEKIVEWTKCYLQHGDVKECMYSQVNEFIN